MRAVRHKHFNPFAVAARIVIGFHQQHPGQFPVCARGGLQGERVHAGDLAQVRRQLVHYGPAACNGVRGRERVHMSKAGQTPRGLIDGGVIFHGATAQRVEPAVHAVGAVSQLGVMTVHIHFRQLRQNRRDLAAEGLRQGARGSVRRGNHVGITALHALFKAQRYGFAHFAHTPFTSSATRASCDASAFSVTHHSMPPSTGRPLKMPSASSAASTFCGATGRSVTNSWKNSPG